MMNFDVVFEPREVAAKLGAIGLTERLLRDVLEMAVAEADTCTEFDPPGNRGHVRWAVGVRALRIFLVPLGWTFNNHASGGLATVIHPSKRLQIAVLAGDANTGRPEAMPATKHPRGSAGIKAIDCNVAQGNLFAFARVPLVTVPKAQEPEPVATLFLLIHEAGDTVFAELSRPTAISDGGRATEFVDRIILAPMATAPEPERPKRFDEGEDRLDIAVTKRDA